MRLLLLSLLLVAGCTATAQRRPTARELGELQDSVWRRLDILLTTDRGFAACTPERETFDGSATPPAHPQPGNSKHRRRRPVVRDRRNRRIVRVHLLRADTAMKARFRRRVHDSPLIRLHGFDPDTTPYPPAPEGAAPPDGLTMEAKYAFYPACTEHIRLTIRHKGDSTVYFGSDYTVCRFQHGRWETLPGADAWDFADRHRPPAISRPRRRPADERVRLRFTAGLRRASIRPYTPVTASAKTFTWKIRAATTCSPPILR
ncbi:MAG: hypothetical protein ACLRMJ_03995 [Alistipes finegoldii]